MLYSGFHQFKVDIHTCPKDSAPAKVGALGLNYILMENFLYIKLNFFGYLIVL